MRFDQHGCLVREKPRDPGHEIANLGDSCADTCRLFVIAGPLLPAQAFEHWPLYTFKAGLYKGWLRHPDLYNLPGKEDWGMSGFTNDQLIPLLMAQYLNSKSLLWSDLYVRFGFIRGTWKLAQPAVYAILWKQWWLLDLLNKAQGLLLSLPFRWSDDKHEGTGMKSSAGKVQDYPTMICTAVFLNKIGYKAKLPRPLDECLNAVRLYRQGPKDHEPNADWEIEAYEKALKQL